MRELISPRTRSGAKAWPSRQVRQRRRSVLLRPDRRTSLGLSLYAVAVVFAGTTKVGELDLNSDPEGPGIC